MRRSQPALLSSIVLAAFISFSSGSIAETSRPILPVYKAIEIDAHCDKGLTAMKAQVEKLEKYNEATAPSLEGFLKEWNRLQITMSDSHAPIYLLSQVSPDEKVREKAEACDIRMRAFNTDLYQNSRIYVNIPRSASRDAIDEKQRQDMLDDFIDSGVALRADKRRKMKASRLKLDAIQQEFARNIRDNKTRVVFSESQMKGLPNDYVERLPRDEQGNYVLDFAYPTYMPFMRYAEDSEARKKYQHAFLNRGTPRNLKLLENATGLRREMAKLAGYPSYADYVLRRRMAKTPQAVDRFLDQIKSATEQAEKAEIQDLKNFRAEAEGIAPADAQINRWDVAYWQEKVKNTRYNVDQNAIRAYFPTDAAVRWALGLASTLYQVEFVGSEVPVWHEDVSYFDVIDSMTKARLGGIYIDLFPREGKYGHAAAFGVRGSSTLEDRTPISVLVANFNRTGLDMDELKTLLHEFGHILHGVLSRTRYVDQAGTSVERDFVEAPSQMFEEWAYSKEALARFPAYCSSACPEVSEDLLHRLNQARKYGKGSFYARQLLYAKYDMALYDRQPESAMRLWTQMESETPLGHVPGTQFPGQFSHTLSGYAAGYYGYLWSEVLALDMASAFGPNLVNPEVGMRYRKAILERGGELPAGELVKNFLGREPNSDAFYRDLTDGMAQ